MKKVLVALTMVMGMGSAVAFAQELVKLPAMEQNQQTSQDKLTKITVKELPQVVKSTLSKDYEGTIVKEAFVAEKENGKVYKIIVTAIKEDQSTEEITVLLNEKGEPVNEKDC